MSCLNGRNPEKGPWAASFYLNDPSAHADEDVIIVPHLRIIAFNSSDDQIFLYVLHTSLWGNFGDIKLILQDRLRPSPLALGWGGCQAAN